LAFQILYAIGVVVGVCLLPESPRWLLATGQPEQAIKNLALLRQLDVNDVNLKREVEDVVAALEVSNIHHPPLQILGYGV
jgi:SP family sugar:H+ symporter-like MFS transporter